MPTPGKAAFFPYVDVDFTTVGIYVLLLPTAGRWFRNGASWDIRARSGTPTAASTPRMVSTTRSSSTVKPH